MTQAGRRQKRLIRKERERGGGQKETSDVLRRKIKFCKSLPVGSVQAVSSTLNLSYYYFTSLSDFHLLPLRSRRAPGDGHDFMWYKLLEFTLSLPLSIGLMTTSVSTLMALTLILEAFTAWTWWNSSLGAGYVIHAREHFGVNIVRVGKSVRCWQSLQLYHYPL